ncbi:aldolase-type tim barrel [Lucifera butyrica]|uniref:Aldolase-type tim barrel n=1 Tax=Lucifera butyrica TaxID=1351585 RepID=A0A498R8Z9_9FIRM|nr:FMN-binding glutamate synthase family protein [Lucifera butyrica]VBB07400.1 aldolase-type tim barrel [Lucifera butyrica]
MQLIMDNPVGLILFLSLLVLAAVLLVKPFFRYIIKKVTNDVLRKILTNQYTRNIVEMLPILKHFSVLNLIELNLRAEEGKVIARPLGSPKHFRGFENLMFIPRQMTKLSLYESTPVDMSVTIGSNAEKPLSITIPFMISAMAYGTGLSENAKMALAKASNRLQTAICSGEGPVLPEEQQEAYRHVLQISRWSWGERTDGQIDAADMLEVQMGQGADLGTSRIEENEIAGRARILGGLAAGQPGIALPAPPGIRQIEDWPDFMKNLRQRAKGKPIGLKLMATDNIEEDLAAAVDLGFDAIVIDGAQGGAHASTPIKQDDFGIPSLYALIRAKRFLGNQNISLIVTGGFFTPGQCLKALALGADAIYLATVPLFALAHKQTDKAMPWEPITTLVFYDSPAKIRLNVEQAATNVANTLKSMVLEMQEAMRALGKASLKELGPEDLVALDSVTAEVTDVKYVLDNRSLS